MRHTNTPANVKSQTVTQSSIPGVLRAKTTIKIFSLVSIGERKVKASLGFPFGGRLCELN